MYNVGDVIWIISAEKPGVTPYRIVEEVTKKTLFGTETIYMVQIPGPAGKRKLKNLDSINGEIHKDIAAARESLIGRASAAIDAMLKRGIDIIEKYSSEEISEEQPEKIAIEDNYNDNQEFVVLPDGTRAKVNFKGDIP